MPANSFTLIVNLIRQDSKALFDTPVHRGTSDQTHCSKPIATSLQPPQVTRRSIAHDKQSRCQDVQYLKEVSRSCATFCERRTSALHKTRALFGTLVCTNEKQPGKGINRPFHVVYARYRNTMHVGATHLCSKIQRRALPLLRQLTPKLTA